MIWLWSGFIALIVIALALDLGVFHRKAHVVSVREALIWTCVWVVLSLAFSVAVYFLYQRRVFGLGTDPIEPLDGMGAALRFLTGWLVEKSLSVDNIFIIALIFAYMRVPPEYQHRTLVWGVLGALVMRAIFIVIGTELIRRVAWMSYPFGVLLLFSAYKLLTSKEESFDPQKNPFFRLARRLYPLTPQFDGERFFSRLDGRRAITPLFLALVLVESSDIFFALDSVPAIIAITSDKFLVYSSNVFAILGLRALYFALAGMMGRFRYLKTSLVVLLGVIGLKMLAQHPLKTYYHTEIPITLSLAVITAVLGVGVLSSIQADRRERGRQMIGTDSGPPGPTPDAPDKIEGP
jgi:tellurite resistance protein TerC